MECFLKQNKEDVFENKDAVNFVRKWDRFSFEEEKIDVEVPESKKVVSNELSDDEIEIIRRFLELHNADIEYVSINTINNKHTAPSNRVSQMENQASVLNIAKNINTKE